MSVVTYKCDTCNRQVEIPQNKKGLEVIQRCVITDGCRGKLHQTELKLNYIRGSLPDSVFGINDWTQRGVLYNHNQTIRSQVWTVTHNLGVFPSIQTYVERAVSSESGDKIELIEIIPESIQTINVNELNVTFNKPESGIAQCIARSTRPTTQQTQTVTTTSTQISTGGELSIATLDNSLTIDVYLRFVSPTGTETTIVYTVDDEPSVLSPWVSVNKVIVKGKTYTVRSFNFLYLLGNIRNEFTDGTIPNGSAFSITGLNSNSQELLILLSAEPHTQFDKIKNQYLDPTTITLAQASTSLIYTEAELYASATLIKTIYPYIYEL